MSLSVLIQSIRTAEARKNLLSRLVPIAFGSVVAIFLLLWAWYQIKAIIFGAIGLAILVGLYAIKKRMR